MLDAALRWGYYLHMMNQTKTEETTMPRTVHCQCGNIHFEPVEGFGDLCPVCVEFERDERDFETANAGDVDGPLNSQV